MLKKAEKIYERFVNPTKRVSRSERIRAVLFESDEFKMSPTRLVAK